MSIVSIIIALLVFSLLVVIHEFGHFIVAKKTGVLVEEFSVGMGPAIVSRQKGETKYSLRAIPMGGYCAMLSEEKKGFEGRTFNDKSILARMAIIFAGPFMNFVLAFLIVFVLLGYSGFVLPKAAALLEGYSAAEAGMEVGDEILSVDGRRVGVYEDLELILAGYDGKGSVPVVVRRDGEKITLNLTPMPAEDGSRYLLGITPEIKVGFYGESFPGYDRAGVFETIAVAGDTMVYHVKSTAVGLFRIFTFKASPDEMAGPIGIVEIIGDSYEAGMEYSSFMALANVLFLMALLSDNLGIVNLLPIPGLDGGRLLLLVIEALRRKPIPPEKEGVIHFIGFLLVIALMIFILYNDIAKLLFR